MPEPKAYIALLRGINVGGNRRVAMADLRRWFEQLGFGQVRTYVQSGNVLFASNQPRPTLAPAIEKKIEQKAGFPVRVVIRSAAELRKVFEANPFLQRARIDAARLHVTFLTEKAGAAARDKLPALARSAQDDELEVMESEVFLHCPNGYGNSKLTNNILEKTLRVAATTRNWRTVNALCAMCEELD